LIINPKNDSAQINLGACYLFGNISDNPMQGIMKIKSVLDKDSLNVYGQSMLALGGKKSGQYDKAIDRFTKVIQLAPNHVEAMVHLAECYELNNQKDKAIQWYTQIRDLIDNQDAKKALNKKIQELKK
jgi:tetratricopeptide (TPR) repeat protein